MKIMHLLAAGGTGGIETLCKNYAKYSAHDNTFVIVWGKDGATYLEMRKNGADGCSSCSSCRSAVVSLSCPG